jgi:hypothetical protein
MSNGAWQIGQNRTPTPFACRYVSPFWYVSLVVVIVPTVLVRHDLLPLVLLETHPLFFLLLKYDRDRRLVDDTCDKETFFLELGDIPVNGINSSSKSSIYIKTETKRRITLEYQRMHTSINILNSIFVMTSTHNITSHFKF